jgi:hypothetical protein
MACKMVFVWRMRTEGGTPRLPKWQTPPDSVTGTAAESSPAGRQYFPYLLENSEITTHYSAEARGLQRTAVVMTCAGRADRDGRARMDWDCRGDRNR